MTATWSQARTYGHDITDEQIRRHMTSLAQVSARALSPHLDAKVVDVDIVDYLDARQAAMVVDFVPREGTR